jgi:hypothetical protein
MSPCAGAVLVCAVVVLVCVPPPTGGGHQHSALPAEAGALPGVRAQPAAEANFGNWHSWLADPWHQLAWHSEPQRIL